MSANDPKRTFKVHLVTLVTEMPQIGTCAHHGCPVIVLERTGNDLRGRCRSAIDQYNELRAFGQIAKLGVIVLLFFRIAGFYGDDFSLNEQAADARSKPTPYPAQPFFLRRTSPGQSN